jgi:hypothetical protein
MPNSRDSIRAYRATDSETESFHVQEPDAVIRKSVLFRRANSVVEPELPLRAYFLSVGGALLLLLLASDWVLPAPLPNPLTASRPSLPPIRINSEKKGPDAVVIAASRFELLPMLPENESAVAPSLLPDSEIADAAVRVSDSSPAPTTETHLRESLALLGSAVHDQADRGRRSRDVTARQRRLAQARSGKRWRSARHQGFETSLGGCVSLSREHGPCRHVLVSN